jgi:hypothetical protein
MLFFLKKKTLNCNIFLTHNKIFLSFQFSKPRRKYLKNRRLFFCLLHSGKLSLEETLQDLRIWFTSINEDALLEQLEDTPKGYAPVINISSQVFLDFNVEEEEVLGKLFTSLNFS